MKRKPESGAARQQGRQPTTQIQVQELLERVSDGFVAFDRQMNYTYVNHRGGELLGRKPEDLVGKNYWTEFPEAKETPFAKAYMHALETQTPLLLEDYYAPWDRWFENRIYPSTDGLSILFTEITERKKAENEMREQNRFISALAQTIPGFVYIHEIPTDKNVYYNNGLEYLLGYTDEDIRRMGSSLFGLILHPDDGPAVQAAQSRLMSAADQNMIESEYRVRRSDGNWRWIRSYERPFARNEDGSLKQKIGISIDITERKLAEEQLQQQIKQLKALRMIDIAINSSVDLQVILNIVLQHMLTQLEVDAGAILLVQPQLQSMEYTSVRGFESSIIQRLPLKLSEGFAGQVVTERRAINISGIQDMPSYRQMSLSTQLTKERFVDYCGTPLIVKGEVKGVLELYHRSPLRLTKEQLEFLEALAGQAAIAIDNAQLFTSMQQAHTDLIIAYDATIAGWSRAMVLRDQHSQGHAQRVADMTLSLARVMNVPMGELVHMRRGALLHDIGMIGVPEHILLQDGPLTHEEVEQVNKHPEFAYDLLSPIEYLQPALAIPYCHHENWDGTGYPRGLKGDEIPLAARIFAVVDLWDVLINGQHGRKGMSKQEALDHIREQSGTQFDPEVVDAFLQLCSQFEDRGLYG